MKYLAFDIGAESGRAVVGILENGRLSLEEICRFQTRPMLVQGHLHWDIYRIFEELKLGLRAATQKYPDIASLGIDSWGCDFGLLTADGILLGLPFMYRDAITEGVPEEVYQIVPREEVYRITGLQTMRVNTLFQLYALKKKQPGYLQPARRLLFIGDLLGYLLTGVALTDPTIASTSQCYDPSRQEWATGLLQRLGLPEDILPPLVQPGKPLGPVLADIAEEYGAGGVEVICVGSHDTACAVAAVPAGSGRWAYISSGTWSVMGVELEQPLLTAVGMNYDFSNEVGWGGRIRYLKNVVGLWLLQGVRRSFEERGADYSYPEIIGQATQATPFTSLIDVTQPEFVDVGDMVDKIAAYCQRTDQPLPEGVGGYTRCVLESLAMRYHELMEMLCQLTGKEYDTLHIVGGGSQNAMLNAFTANACHTRVLAGPSEATATGNILVQAISRGEVASLKEGRQLIQNSLALAEFQPENPAAWDKAYHNYLAARR